MIKTTLQRQLSLQAPDSLYKKTLEQLASGFYLEEEILNQLREHWVQLADQLDLFKMLEATYSYSMKPTIVIPNLFSSYEDDYLTKINNHLVKYRSLSARLSYLNNNIAVIKSNILYSQDLLDDSLIKLLTTDNHNFSKLASHHKDKIKNHIDIVANEYLLIRNISLENTPEKINIEIILKLLNKSLIESEILKDIYTSKAEHQEFANYLFSTTIKPMPHHQIIEELFNLHYCHGFNCIQRDLVTSEMAKVANELEELCNCNNDYKTPSFNNVNI